jgi:hypothetical protein
MNANLQILDSLVARAVQLTGTYGGVYIPGAAYTLNTTVTDPLDSSLWQANAGFTTLVTNTFAQERSTNPTHWTNVTVATANAATSATIAAGAATGAGASSVAASNSANTASTAATAAALSATAAASGASFSNMGRNLVHNSQFKILQRGAGPFTTTNAYGPDRWQLGLSGSTMSVSAVTAVDGVRSAIGDESVRNYLSSVVVGSAGVSDYTLLQHKIEDVRRLAGKTVTVSFWAASNTLNQKLGIEFVQFFGTGGAPSTSVTNIGSQFVTIPGSSWARYSVTISLPSIIGKLLGTNGDDNTGLIFWQTSGSGNNARAGGIGVQSYTLSLWGVQVEIASSVTPLERSDPRIDLANCQRFYTIGQTVIGGYGVAGAGAGETVTLPVAMRAQPLVNATTTSNTNIVSFILNGALAGNQSLWVTGTVSATGNWQINSTWAAGADL